MKNRFIMRAGIIVIYIFIMVNIVWGVWVHKTYTKYINAFDGIAEKSEFSSLLGSEYRIDNKYILLVKKPDYLSREGNLSITYMVEDGDEYPINNSIVIWPLKNEEYEYGVTLINEYNMYNVYVDENLDVDFLKYNDVNSPTYDPKYYTEMLGLIEDNREDLLDLNNKANEIWKLK